MKKCFQYFISGKVQGVGYRASVQKFAQQQRISGFVRNLDDGRVEVVACGDDQQLKVLQDWLLHGPARAEVFSVTATAIECNNKEGFRIVD